MRFSEYFGMKVCCFTLKIKEHILIFFQIMFFSIGRNCFPKAKLGEYVVHIIDNTQKKFERWSFQENLFSKFSDKPPFSQFLKF